MPVSLLQQLQPGVFPTGNGTDLLAPLKIISDSSLPDFQSSKELSGHRSKEINIYNLRIEAFCHPWNCCLGQVSVIRQGAFLTNC